MSYIGRYYGPETSRNKALLKRPEAEALSAAGLEILSIWEGAGDKYESFTSFSGQRDAKRALDQAIACGQPVGSAIYFTVDFDATPVQVDSGVTAYFTAVREVMAHYRVGCYGHGLALSELRVKNLIDYTFLACAMGWRGSRAFAGKEDIRQGLPTTIVGVPADPETVIRPNTSTVDQVGAWRLEDVAVEHGAEAAPPRVTRGDTGPAVLDLQHRLTKLNIECGTPDGVFGSKTWIGVAAFQRAHDLLPDGIVGRKTWAAIKKAS